MTLAVMRGQLLAKHTREDSSAAAARQHLETAWKKPKPITAVAFMSDPSQQKAFPARTVASALWVNPSRVSCGLALGSWSRAAKNSEHGRRHGQHRQVTD